MARKRTLPQVAVLTAKVEKASRNVSVSCEDLADLSILFEPDPDLARHRNVATSRLDRGAATAPGTSTAGSLHAHGTDRLQAL